MQVPNKRRPPMGSVGVLACFRPAAPGEMSDDAAPCSGAAGDRVHDDDNDHCADDGGYDRAHGEWAVDDVDAEQRAGEEATDDRADDAEHDVPDDAEALVTPDEETGQVAGDRAEHDPGNDAHELPPSLRGCPPRRAGFHCLPANLRPRQCPAVAPNKDLTAGRRS